jgi:hypothetical protein
MPAERVPTTPAPASGCAGIPVAARAVLRHRGGMTARLHVLVEGASDRAAVEALAARRGLDLAACGAVVVLLGGAGGAHRAITAAVAAGADVCGLYDVGEQRFVASALVRSGLAATGDRAELAALGFHACERDLEDELVRALGVEATLDVVERLGDLDRFRTFSAQPEWRGRPAVDRLHRFFGTTSGRKQRYGRALALATPAEPPPLRALLDDVAALAQPRPSQDTPAHGS